MGGIFEKLWQIVIKNPRESLKIQANLSKSAYANQRGGGRAKRTKFGLFGRFFNFRTFEVFLDIFGIERFGMFLDVLERYWTSDSTGS